MRTKKNNNNDIEICELGELEDEMVNSADDEKKVVDSTAQAQITKKFGKFEDENALYEGYKSLESEFTKRCQEHKKLKEVVNDLTTEVASLQNKMSNILADEEFIELAAKDKNIYQRAVLDFLNSKASVDIMPVLGSGIGQAAAAVVAKPKNLREASALALKLLG